MTWTQLTYFYQTAKIEHLTKAAEELNISQSSLSLSIKHLEDELGVLLFDRKGRTIRLNKYGRLFYQKIGSILEDMDSTLNELLKLKLEEENNVIIRSPSLFGYPGLMNRLNGLGVNLSVRSPNVSRSEMLTELVQHKIDFVIVAEDIDHPNLHCTPLSKIPMVIYMSSSHPLAGQKSVSWKDLTQYPFAAYPKGTVIRCIFDSFFTQAGIYPLVTYESSIAANIVDSVRNNDRLALLSKNMISTLRMEGISPLPISDMECFLTLRMYWPNNLKERTAARILRREILDYFQKL